MKNFSIVLLLSTFAFIFWSCNSSNKECTLLVDSLKKQLAEYRKQEYNKNDKFTQLYNQFQKFETINDSIKKREQQIDSLKAVIKKRGSASSSDNKMLNNLLAQIDKFLEKNQDLAKELDSLGVKKADPTHMVNILLNTIQDKQKQVNYMKNDIAQLQREVKGLKVEKENLVVANVELNTKLDTLKNVKNEILNKAQKLIVSDILFTFPSNIFKGTKKAKNIDNIKICFSINANEFAPKGSKTIHVRIAMPDGNILYTSTNDLFTSNGQEIAYTLKKVVNYTGSKLNDCFEWTKPKQSKQKLAAGQYEASFFLDGQLIESKNFKLE